MTPLPAPLTKTVFWLLVLAAMLNVLIGIDTMVKATALQWAAFVFKVISAGVIAAAGRLLPNKDQS